MPLGKNTRYRWKGKGPKAVRLAFQGNKVVEVKKQGEPAKMVAPPRSNKT